MFQICFQIGPQCMVNNRENFLERLTTMNGSHFPRFHCLHNTYTTIGRGICITSVIVSALIGIINWNLLTGIIQHLLVWTWSTHQSIIKIKDQFFLYYEKNIQKKIQRVKGRNSLIYLISVSSTFGNFLKFYMQSGMHVYLLTTSDDFDHI